MMSIPKAACWQAPMVSTGDVEPATVVNNLRQALDAIGGLSSERASLEQVSGLAQNAQPARQPRGSPETGSSVALHPELNSLLSSAPPPGPCSLCSAAPCIHQLLWLINCSLPYARQADSCWSWHQIRLSGLSL